ncbi:MAG: hypothetical protein OEW68_09075 [Gammaproteobacteria bacterium]|nr:hypothetical protein [Gammaproteobacteria bacterium]MDH4314979.1 hypothetical protein [Gammaproteobacteria bacterium]MDH5214387.1 hypothetical protein [Gammaproteobacteria bacterium]
MIKSSARRYRQNPNCRKGRVRVGDSLGFSPRRYRVIALRLRVEFALFAHAMRKSALSFPSRVTGELKQASLVLVANT